MVPVLARDAAQMALAASGTPNGKLEEPDHSSSNWYFSREEIEKRSPSRLDGIDLKRETYFRKSYCTFLQDLGMCLKVPQVTIATAIVFSHRFFLRQSHLKNDRHMIATICMFLAGKVEETPRPLRDVILMSYEIRHKKDPFAIAKIKQKETYEEQKELVLVGERLVLTTLGFDLNIAHPYKPLVAAIKKLKVAQNALAQVAWNFVNDGLRTSLCLQFKPHHIAAGAIFLAAKFLKVKLPSDGEKVWWQEFGVTPRQLEEVSNQMLELYEQNKALGTLPNGCRSNDPGSCTVSNVTAKDSVPSASGHHWNHNSSGAAGVDKIDKHAQTVKTDDVATSTRRDEVYDSASHVSGAYVKLENGRGGPDLDHLHENGSVAGPSEITVDNTWAGKSASSAQVKLVVKEEVKEQLTIPTVFEDGQIKEQFREKKGPTDFRVKSESGTISRKARVKSEMEDRKPATLDGGLKREATEAKSSLEEREMEDVVDSKPGVEENMESVKVKVENEDEEPKKVWVTSIEDVNTDRVKALAQKRRKSKGEGLDSKPHTVKVEPTDEEELLERELESGVEAAAEAERVKQERKDVKSKMAQKVEQASMTGKKEGTEDGDAGSKRRRFSEEEGVNEKKRTKSSEKGDRAEWADGEADRSRLGGPSDRTEDGELPSSSHPHDQMRSPRQSDRRSVASGSHEKNGSPSSLKRHRDPHGRRDGHRDSRVGHGSRERDYYQRDNHHRTDGDRDRHHHKERDYQDRDHKKVRPYELHGN